MEGVKLLLSVTKWPKQFYFTTHGIQILKLNQREFACPVCYHADVSVYIKWYVILYSVNWLFSRPTIVVSIRYIVWNLQDINGEQSSLRRIKEMLRNISSLSRVFINKNIWIHYWCHATYESGLKHTTYYVREYDNIDLKYVRFKGKTIEIVEEL